MRCCRPWFIHGYRLYNDTQPPDDPSITVRSTLCDELCRVEFAASVATRVQEQEVITSSGGDLHIVFESFSACDRSASGADQKQRCFCSVRGRKEFHRKKKKKGISAGKKERKEANRQDGKKGGRCGPNSSVHLTGWRERRVVPAIGLVMPTW